MSRLFKTGDRIYFKHSYDNFCAAIIKRNPYDDAPAYRDYYKVSLTDGNYGTTGVRKDECFVTMEECLKYHQAKSDRIHAINKHA